MEATELPMSLNMVKPTLLMSLENQVGLCVALHSPEQQLGGWALVPFKVVFYMGMSGMSEHIKPMVACDCSLTRFPSNPSKGSGCGSTWPHGEQIR